MWKTFFIFHFPLFFNLLQNTKNVTCEYEFVVVFCSPFVVVVVTALARLSAATVVVVVVLVVVVALLCAVKLKRAPTAENKLTLNVKFIEIVYVGAAIVLLLLLLLFFCCCCFLVVVYRMAFEHIFYKRLAKGSFIYFLSPSCSASFLLQIRLRLLRPFPGRLQSSAARPAEESVHPSSPSSTLPFLYPCACLPVRLVHPNGLCGPVRVRVSPQLRFLFALLE